MLFLKLPLDTHPDADAQVDTWRPELIDGLVVAGWADRASRGKGAA